MSPVTRALRQKFESVARAELQRMKKKTASFSEAERAQLEAISVHVVHALAAELEHAIERPGGERLEGVVSKIFVLSEQPAETTAPAA